MKSFTSQHVQTLVSGRYLVHKSRCTGQCPVLVGFHGYGEDAETHLKCMKRIPDTDEWLMVAVEALHPFYNRRGEIGASWMTSKDRELKIRENITYINTVVAQVMSDYEVSDTIVYSGFSQGAAMACRAAMFGNPKPSGVMILGGDIPPECKDLSRMRHILIGRGSSDTFYTNEKWQQDLERIKQSGLTVSECIFEGGHVWDDDYSAAAGTFLKACHAQSLAQ